MDLTNLGVGYFFDWDIGSDESKNRVGTFEDAIPENLKGNPNVAAEIAYSTLPGYPYIGCAVYSEEPGAIAQAAGLSSTILQNFDKANQIKALTSGTSWQFTDVGDISFVVGMLFPGIIHDGEKRNFVMSFGGISQQSWLADILKYGLEPGFTNVENNDNPSDYYFEIFPQPSESEVNAKVELPDDSRINIEIYDMLGNQMFEQLPLNLGAGSHIIELASAASLSQGTYLAIFKTGKTVIAKKFVKIY
ncbi:MAG: hypothetical protein QG635_161 [Bacteroidota bacterium]|nr:hypothetical protein [Bacteroidota bacterium]